MRTRISSPVNLRAALLPRASKGQVNEKGTSSSAGDYQSARPHLRSFWIEKEDLTFGFIKLTDWRRWLSHMSLAILKIRTFRHS